MYEGIISTIGNTPLVKLSRILQPADFNLYAKLEAFNPGGSIKDRTAFSILKNALDNGLIYPGSTVIESSSGNMGIGLAQACAYFGLNFICVIDPKTTALNIEILKAFGAQVDLISTPDPVTGEFLQARINRVNDLLRQIENSFWPDQYRNLYNPMAHYRTMHEIVQDLDGRVDYLFCATSTCGTLRGCADYIRMNNLRTKLYAVDAVGSVIFSDKKGKRLIPGHGAAVRPKLYQPNLADDCIHVTDTQCVVGCRLLVKEEAILAGGSSGAVLMAVESFRQRIPRGANCVVLFPDRGERYLDTIYSDAWVAEHFGEVSLLMEEHLAEKQYA
jgi:cysteine synthase A